jgi:hypothetical protein
LALETLEGRLAPAVDMWTGAVNQSWSNGGNWSLHRAPLLGDVAGFTYNSSVKTTTLTLNVNTTIAGVQIDGTFGGNINVTATLTLTGTSEFDSGAIYTGARGNVINRGTLTMNNSSNQVNLGGAGALTNYGLINQKGRAPLNMIGTSGGASTLVNTIHGVYNFLSDSGILGGSNGAFINAGTIEKTGGRGTSTVTSPLTNTGTLNAVTGTLGFQGTSTSTNATYKASAGATLDLIGGNVFATTTQNGTLTAIGSGRVLFDAGTMVIGSGGASFNGPSGAYSMSGGALDIPVGVTLTLNSTLNLINSGNFTIEGGGTLLNQGTINQKGNGWLVLTGSPALTLNNTASALYNFQNDSGITGGNQGLVVNAGTIEKTGHAGTSTIGATLNNTGILHVFQGVLQLANNSSNTGGVYNVAAGATLDLTGGQVFSETGVFTALGSGTITLANGTFAVFNNSATLNIPAGLSFTWTGGALSVPTGNSLSVNGNLLLSGAGGESLRGGGSVTLNGLLTQTGAGNLDIASTNGSGTTLNIAQGAIYDLTTNSGITGGDGILNNAGTIEKTSGGGVSVIASTFNNTGGNLTATAGTLQLDTRGGENTGGSFTVTAGAIIDLTGGSTVSYSGTYTGSGTGEVLLSSGTLKALGGTNPVVFNLQSNQFVWSGGTIDTSNANLTILGTLNVTGSNGHEVLAGGGTLTVGSASAAGTLNHLSTGNLLEVGGQSTLAVAPMGVLNVADSKIGGGGGVSNQGLLHKTAGTSAATVSASLDNQGIVEVDTGTLVLSGTVDQVFSGTLTGGSWTVQGGAGVQSALNITSSNFTVLGVAANVTLNGANASFSNLSGLATNNGSLSVLGGASLSTGASLFTNAGSLTLGPGSVLNVNGAFTQTSGGTETVLIGGTDAAPAVGSVSATGAITLGGTLVVTSTVVPAVGTSLQILTNGNAAAVSGTYSGLAEGATFGVTVDSTVLTFQISYLAGSGSKNAGITRMS